MGFALPAHLGLVRLSAKPQIGIAVALFRTVKALPINRARGVLRLLWLRARILGVSLALFGPWHLRASQEITAWRNDSLWPASILLGLGLLAGSLGKR